MHAFPPAAELEFLVGLEIGQVCLDPWSIQLMFSEGGHIAVEGPLEHVDLAGNIHRHQDGDEQDRGPVFLRELIQRRITQVAVDGLCLSLFIDGGAILRLFADASPYECVLIYPPDGRPAPLVF